ncbi:MAG TPA: hypothetical protein DHV42_05865 [Lachnospiraceae bacterium]|jgi:phosphotransferase system HPr (HPr) family protein|nr:hypothetical protein [Lachnospiraceae bacterium]
MIEKEIVLGCSGGLFLRDAGAIREKAMQYRCRSELVIGDECYNLRSVLSVLSAQVCSKREALLRCDGVQEAQAILDLQQLLEEEPKGGQPA